MTIEDAVVERLMDVTAVTAIVGARIYLLKLPQRPTLPAIRIQRVVEGSEYHYRGESYPRRTRVQVDAYAHEESGGNPLASAKTLAEAIHGDGDGPFASGLSGWIGPAGGSPVTMNVLGIFRVDSAEDYEAGELRVVRVRQDYRVLWVAI